jgi:hypothetical protein
VQNGQLFHDMEGQKPDDEGHHRCHRGHMVCLNQREHFWQHIKGHYTEQHPCRKTEQRMDLLLVPKRHHAAQERGEGRRERQHD